MPGSELEVGEAGAIGLTLGLSLLHGVLPNHWLPFVAVGRAQGWSRGRTLSVLLLAGGGHVLATSVLGIAVWWLGDAVFKGLGHETVERAAAWVAGALLAVLGIAFLVRHALGKKHSHTHALGSAVYHRDESGELHPEGEDHDHAHAPAHTHARMSDRAAIGTLFLALTLSPCEAVVIAFASAWRFGFAYALVLAIGASLATVLAMLAATWITIAGRERLRFPWLDRNEMALTGVILIIIGIVVVFLPS